MITKDNLKDLLIALNFEESKGLFIKSFTNTNTSLSVDFSKGLLLYPEDKGLIVNGRQTCNFSSNENFVVFECVHRLLDKGYKPEHIELEPKWQLGHGGSGGRADILIKDNSGKSLLIIECKTEGREFNEAWKIMLSQATQLFSYAQQVKSTQFICLYASDYENQKVVYNNYIITLQDNEKLLLELADKEPLSYKNAQETEDIFKVWKHTYAQDAATKGIFEEDKTAYDIGKLKFTLSDLNMVSSKDIQGKYHEFATILRQHNVSGRENAFDKLVNLFLCKVVDENEHSNDLQFYWKGIAYDNYFDLIDRLQRLYKIGMDKFLEEEVTYVDEQSIDDAFRYFKNDKDATKDTIKSYFRQLKFFTNSDFAFIDVHNENLFYQNSEVLLKIVKLLQDIRLKTDEQNQFLGDMFEGFLDQGIKQSEGQFFTPMPIVKFVLSSLPLEQIIADSEIPKVIDYACGAGHFLNEYATQIKPIVEKIKKVSVSDYYPEIVGIEKEYRLSKVAKVSAFMYGQDDINIIYTDALAETPSIKDGSFSVLIANPPYSVKGFLETLKPIERKRFELINTIDGKSYPNNNSIETFFIERAKQLLKPGGIAAIIVPSSIISKGSQKNTSKKQNVYVATRELLIKYFDIVAIAEFGKGTFGKTGTNTVTLFLRRKSENPSMAEQYRIRIDSWFNGDNSKDTIFADEYYIKSYCDHIEISFEEYSTFLRGAPSEHLLNTEIFKMYYSDFEKNSEIKKKIQSLKKVDPQNRKGEIDNLFLSYLHRIEKDKLYFYVLTNQNPQNVLIISSPSETAAEKKFLGYEWSAAKGKEGIKYMGNAKVKIESDIEEKDDDGIVVLEEEDKRVLGNIMNLATIQTPLYDPKSRNNIEKINCLIQANFNNELVVIPESLKQFVTSLRLVDVLDFNRIEFNKAFQLSTKKNVIIESKWPSEKLGLHIEYLPKSKRKASDGVEAGQYPFFTSSQTQSKWLDENDYTEQAVILGTGGIASIHLSKNFSTSADVFCIKATNGLTNEYIFYFFQNNISLIENGFKGVGLKHLSKEYLDNLNIPCPSPEIQAKIAFGCTDCDTQADIANMQIKHAKAEIERAITDVYNNGHLTKKLSDPTIAILNPSKTEVSGIDENTIVSFVEMASVSEEGFIQQKEDKPLKELKKGSYKYFKEDDIIIAKITPCMENGKCAIAAGLTNQIGLGSSEFHVIRVCEGISNKFIFTLLNRETVRNEAEKKMTGSSGHRRVPVSFYENFLIPILNKNEQDLFLSKIATLEDQIKNAQLLIKNVSKQKKQVIMQYL